MASSGKEQNFKVKNKKFKAKSQKLKLFRSNEPLHSVFMWGISHTINELSLVQAPPMFLPEDFKAYSKIRVDNHLFNREKFPSHFKFKEYCPLVFRKLREGFNIDDQAYARSFCVPLSHRPTSGRSGAMFLTSRNKKFIAKTMYKEEVEMMHQLLPKYYQFMVEKNSNSLLPHYLGMYRVTVENKETYFVIMESIFGKLKIHKKYDLKGSTVDRQAKTKEKEKEKSSRKIERSTTWKDQDFLADGTKIYVGEEVKKDFMEKLKDDVDFLCKLKIMDYSLLVGIHDFSREDEESDVEDGFDSQDESDNDSPIDYDASGTNESACDSPTSSPPGTPPATPPITPPPSCLTPTSRPPLKSRTVSEDSIEADLGSEFYAIPCCKHTEQYYIGIVDVLTYYGTKKRTAHAAKTVKHGGQEISTVKPEAYGKRFLDFVDKAIE